MTYIFEDYYHTNGYMIARKQMRCLCSDDVPMLLNIQRYSPDFDHQDPSCGFRRGDMFRVLARCGGCRERRIVDIPYEHLPLLTLEAEDYISRELFKLGCEHNIYRLEISMPIRNVGNRNFAARVGSGDYLHLVFCRACRKCYHIFLDDSMKVRSN